MEHALEPGAELVVGRGQEAHIQVLDPSVSRRHLLIRGGPPPTVEDLGSSAGSAMGGERLRAGEPRAIPLGGAIEIGSAVLLLQGVPTSQHADGTATDAGAMGSLQRLIELASPSSLTILILGETGVGKEVIATRIHALSSRAKGPFVKVNCAAFSDSLLDSELFGHARGAFTGATHDKAGLVEAAHGGTLFLDEVGEMSPETQAKVLRVLDNREVRRVGATQSIAVDVRFIAATNRDLEAEVTQGRFRSDLYFRLNGLALRVPPLRHRRTELLQLAREFAAAAADRAGRSPPGFTRAAEVALLAHSFPGNVRELKNLIERGVVLSQGGPIDVDHLLLSEPAVAIASDDARRLRDAVEAAERSQIVAALATADGNQSKAAELLGVSRRTLLNRLEAYGLPRPRKNRR